MADNISKKTPFKPIIKIMRFLFQSTSKGIFFRPKRLDKFRKLTEDDEEEIFQEFTVLEEYERLEEISSQSNRDPKNLQGYRFADIRARGPWKDTAVHLTENHREDDYINANEIKMLHKDHDYIACQGPLERTSENFWDMILQYRVSKIVMLTKTHEQNRNKPPKLVEKCFQYFPKESNIPLTFGSIIVQVTNIDLRINDLEIRRINITRNNDQHNVTHFYFTGWPDFNVIKPDRFLALIDQVNRAENCPSDSYKSNQNQTSPPIVVHCSAGVGRTGTYIALDVLLSLLDRSDSDALTMELDVMGTVYQLRLARNKMVQTKEQYLLLYRCIEEQLNRTKRLDAEDNQLDTSDKCKLNCNGHPCAKCHKCRDWYFTGHKTTFDWIQHYNSWTFEDWERYDSDKICRLFEKRDNATCSDSFDPLPKVIHLNGHDYHFEDSYFNTATRVTDHRYRYRPDGGSSLICASYGVERYHNMLPDLCLCKNSIKN